MTASPTSGGPLGAAASTPRDFRTDQEVRWCPGCGNYAILATVQQVLPELGIPREKIVFVSGIGCSSRFPYYVNTYGMHGIHGRAPAIATGLAVSRPDLSVWVVTGDGDALSIGGNHLIHALRRNVNLKILMFNNRIYGLTKGQFSPTSEFGKITKTSPRGSVDHPFNPLSLAIGAGASFAARSVASDRPHLSGVLRAAAAHRGTAFVEIFQNCEVFNNGAFDRFVRPEGRAAWTIPLEAGRPLRFGRDGEKGVVRAPDGLGLTVATRPDPAEVVVHDPGRESPAYAFALSCIGDDDGCTTPLGVLRAVEDWPTYEELIADRDAATGPGTDADLAALFLGRDHWTVGPPGTP